MQTWYFSSKIPRCSKILMIVLTHRLSKKSLIRPPNAIDPIMKFNGMYGTKSAN